MLGCYAVGHCFRAHDGIGPSPVQPLKAVDLIGWNGLDKLRYFVCQNK